MKVNNSSSGSTEKLRDSVGTTGTGAVNGNREKRPPMRSPEAGGSEYSEKVAISGKARDIAKAREAASSAPDIDEARVARLKAAIQNGSYKVDAEKVADRLVDDHLATSF